MKIKWGALMVDGRGKIGGQVASKNRSGAYMRNKVTPSNPRTFDQQANRALLGSLSAGWSSLNTASRNSFNNAVANWAKTNIFGDSVKPTGKNLYTALNKNLASVGEALLVTAPPKVEMPILGLNSVNVNLTDETIEIEADGDVSDVFVVISATPVLTNGTTFTKGKYRRIASSFGAYPVIEDLYSAYVTKFGPISIGNNISFEVKLIAQTGQMSVPETAKANVTT
jgi:hypothetical protein